MAHQDDERYSEEETQRRVEASLRAAFKMGPMPRTGAKAKGGKPEGKPPKGKR
jgi:hypothetical protein